jgi:septal ring factor EnvC (AmiA/AmiB activator)
VIDLVGRIAVDPYEIRRLLLSHEAASSFAPRLPDELASAREELERLRAEATQQNRKVETLRTELAQTTGERDFLAEEGAQLRADAARQSQEADALGTEMSRITGERDFSGRRSRKVARRGGASEP